MTFLRINLAIVLAISFASHAGAQFRSSTGLKVNETAPSTYTVSGVPNYGPADYWCAMGEFAQRELRLDNNDRIYVKGNYVKGQRDYRFTTSPVGTASEETRLRSSNLRKDGANMRVNAARAECSNRF